MWASCFLGKAESLLVCQKRKPVNRINLALYSQRVIAQVPSTLVFQQMQLQLFPAHEDLVASAAPQHLLLLVHILHVHLQDRLTVEQAAADQALETVLARMVEQVGAQIAALNERLLTELTGERSIISVRIQVSVQCAFQREIEIAFRAPVWSFVRMHSSVLD